MSDDLVLRESLAALRLSPPALRAWLEDRRRFCLLHGGRAHYPEVLDLVEECLALIDREAC